MAANRHLARAVMDGVFLSSAASLTTQLDDKARLAGCCRQPLVSFEQDLFLLGVVKQALALSQRTFACDACGFEVGRDHNAALNLARLAASSAVTACGEACSGVAPKSRVKRAPVKQEENTALLGAD